MESLERMSSTVDVSVGDLCDVLGIQEDVLSGIVDESQIELTKLSDV